MAIVRYEMPGSGTPPDEARQRFGEFFASPLLTAVRLFQPKPRVPFYFPVEVDTETGLVSVEFPTDALERRGRDKGVQLERYREANEARRYLEEAFSTGAVPRGTPKDYRGVAELIAQLEHEPPPLDPAPFDVFQREADAPDEPQSTDPYPEFSMAGYIPPGGVAGFAQMAPASRIALTSGVRAGGGGRRKRKARRVRKTKKRSTRRASGGRRKLVKGSAAAKRFMANLRKRRRK